MNLLSRNTPVAYVVGAAGFIGSHLVERYLEKGVQVVGVDDLTFGKEKYLGAVLSHKYFNFINQSGTKDLPFQLPRLDYAFFVISENIPASVYSIAFANFLALCRTHHSKIVLVSSINLYDQQSDLKNLKSAEKELAIFSAKNSLNARIVRLSALFGPRMHFREDDPMVRLVQSAILGDLQKESAPLDFTTRSLYINDAVDLLIKAVMHSGTSHKIYDGAILNPVKVTEIKQVLLDPLWHEQKGFNPTELPPWPTPNLLKTSKELLWRAHTPLVVGLRQTLHYFKEDPSQIEVIKAAKNKTEQGHFQRSQPVEPKVEDKVAKKAEGRVINKEEILKRQPLFPSFGKEIHSIKKPFLLFLGTFIIIYALIYPVFDLFWQGFQVKNHLQESSRQVWAGDFDQAQIEAQAASSGVKNIKEIVDPWAFLGNFGPLRIHFDNLNQVIELLNETTEAVSYSIQGIQALSQSFKVMSGGEGNLDQTQVQTKALMNLNQASRQFGVVGAKLSDGKIAQQFPGYLQNQIINLKNQAFYYQKLASQTSSYAFILSQVFSDTADKNYLVILQDNSKLRAGGGAIRSYGEISFKQGKLSQININTISSLDIKLTDHVEPPADIKTDLGVTDWKLGSSNSDLDFPTNARWAEWFYGKEGGSKVSGIIALDLTALSKILEAVGPVNLKDSGEIVSNTNLMEKVTTKGVDDKYLSAVLKEALSKLFFLDKQNWSLLFENIDASLQEKHLMVYVSDPLLFSYLSSLGWTGALPKQAVERRGERNEFLALSETSLGAGSAGILVKRAAVLESTLGRDDSVKHKLTINYTNQAVAETLNYKMRLKVYLAAGSKLAKATWGDKDILKEVKALSDYGRAGYSVLLELNPKDQKSLVLEYQDIKPLAFDNNNLNYSLTVIKQPGTDSSPFDFRLNLPDGQQNTSSGLLSTNLNYQTTVKKAVKL